MQDTIRGNTQLIWRLTALCEAADGVSHTLDCYGNAFHWFRLVTPAKLTDAGKQLKAKGARLCVTCAYNRKQLSEPMQEVCYSFELEGIVYNITVTLNGEWPSVPSITPVFTNADWHEREMAELYGIKITGHPTPSRLFLDEKLDQGLLNEAVPLSVMMNGATTTDLWERILKDKG
jgi:NADH:ubiquinone oxidoreductase subunit C